MPHQKHVDILEGNKHFLQRRSLHTSAIRKDGRLLLLLKLVSAVLGFTGTNSDLIRIVKDRRPHTGRLNSRFKSQGSASPPRKDNHSLVKKAPCCLIINPDRRGHQSLSPCNELTVEMCEIKTHTHFLIGTDITKSW